MSDSMERRDSRPLVGGVFGLEFAAFSKRQLPWHAPAQTLTANARSAFWLILKSVKPHRVFLPSFLCPVLIDAVREAGLQPQFYAVNFNLEGDLRALQDVGPGDVILAIEYFGFPVDTEFADALAEARQAGAVVVLDSAQALLSKHGNLRADFQIFSPRKFCGVPDGGILTGLVDHGQLNASPPQAWLAALEANIRRAHFDRGAENRDWFQHFQYAEHHQCIGAYRMSDVTEHVLNHAVDWSDVSDRRRSNYLYLHERIGEHSLRPRLDGCTVPIGFPVRIPNRDAIRQALFREEIFPPIHWPIEGWVPDEFTESHSLSAEIMTLPCDQRYNERDLDRMIHALTGALKR